VLSEIRSMARSTVRSLLFGCAVLWILIEALLVLIATFRLPNGPQLYITALAGKPGIEGMTGRLINEGWPAIILVFLMLTWQEVRRWAKQWFKTAKGHERADLMIVSWFVFLGTLSVVDYLSDVTLVLPMGARETSVVLAYFMMASWCSRIAHWAKRQYERRRSSERRTHRDAPKKGPLNPRRQAGTRRSSTHGPRRVVHA
jgi:hypothetical protein